MSMIKKRDGGIDVVKKNLVVQKFKNKIYGCTRTETFSFSKPRIYYVLLFFTTLHILSNPVLKSNTKKVHF